MRNSVLQLISLIIFLIAVVVVLASLYFGFREDPNILFDDNQTTSSHYEHEYDQQYEVGVN